MRNVDRPEPREPEVPAGVPDRAERASLEENVGAGLGIVAGAAAGSIAGPIGMLVGATVGSLVGDVAGSVLHERDVASSMRDHELDDAIGVTSGPLGADAVLDFPLPASSATFLRSDHDDLAALTEELMGTIVGGDRDAIAEAIAELQRRTLTHIDGEERDLFAAYARHDAADAERLLREHAAIRKALADLDVTVDLHLVRADAIKVFLGALRAHAAHENGGLYRWAAAETT